MDQSGPSGFTVERIESGGDVTLVLSGELDLASAAELQNSSEQVPADGSLTLDLAELDFIDSSGLRVLMNLDLRARREGWTLSIRNPHTQVLRLLELSGFHERLPIDQPAPSRPAGP